jgi:hypothetical protein
MPIGYFPRTPLEQRIAAGGPGRHRGRRKGYRPPPFKRRKPYKAPPPPEAPPQIQVKAEPPPIPVRYEPFREIEVRAKFIDELAPFIPIPSITPSVKSDIFDIVLSRKIKPQTFEVIIESPPIEAREELPLEVLTSDFTPSFEEEEPEVMPMEIILPNDIEEDDIPFIVALAEDELELAALFAAGV